MRLASKSEAAITPDAVLGSARGIVGVSRNPTAKLAANLPGALCDSALELVHEGHQGVNRCKARARRCGGQV